MCKRGDSGATMNRMEHTIDNLFYANIVVNTQRARSRIQDGDMAAESIRAN